jgi:hypothetical protein
MTHKRITPNLWFDDRPTTSMAATAWIDRS